jgi:hypothetical protein
VWGYLPILKVRYINSIESDSKITDELDRIWKATAVLASIPEGTDETTETSVSIASVLAEIRTKRLPNTSLDRYS